jgi:hypothetical protein
MVAFIVFPKCRTRRVGQFTGRSVKVTVRRITLVRDIAVMLDDRGSH